ncbi:histidine kinase [Aliidongia dinghuensis]|uniref:Histidine kinase n=1 Tax=Aliidongia dinghuensis TaxID=1867774 RepID=A0A8J3E522_9PROT|nr:CBS domain-containing protein [Aliidongia dinghuensis]GGF43518.1 histidine kinase [Aliidongia dinghuensis]
MKASDVMTQGPIVTVHPETSLEEAAGLMIKLHISGLPVVDAAGKLVGILTEGDLLRRAEIGTAPHRRRWVSFLSAPGRLADEYVQTHGIKVGDLMSRDVVMAAPDTPLEAIVGLLEQHCIKRLPIVEGDRLLGIVSRLDLVRALLRQLELSAPAARSDDDILRDVAAVFEDEVWVPRAGVRVEVHDGIVDLCGLIYDERQRSALRVAAETVAGVKLVRDHLTWVKPASDMTIGVGVPL